MTLTHPLPEKVVELIAYRFRVIGEPTRIRLLELLRDGELTVTELVERTGATQQNVSKHLAVLLHAGIVGRRKQGVSVHYRIADTTVFDVCELVCGSLERQLTALGREFQAVAS
jgi:DNA-binding transcriptional ArsR family regulator